MWIHLSFTRASVAFVVLALISAPQVSSAEVGLNFTGRIQFVGVGPTSDYGETYGTRLPMFSTLSGHFAYESNTLPYSISSDTCIDCMAYHHKQTNGLHVEFQGLTLQADEYIVQMKNDVFVAGYGTADVLGVWYPDSRDPLGQQLSKPLKVNGMPVTKGGFAVEFVARPETFASSQLPSSLDPSVFVPSNGFGTFGDGIPEYNTLDVYFKPTTIFVSNYSTSDHDLDGDVDGADFLIWQRGFGSAIGDGDANSDLFVNEDDLALWHDAYGLPIADLYRSVIPEPSAYALLLSTCFFCFWRR